MYLKSLLSSLMALLIVSAPLRATESLTPEAAAACQIAFSLSCFLEEKFGLVPLFDTVLPQGGKYSMGLSLKTPRLFSLEEGRALLVNCTQEVAKAVNASPEARSYFAPAGRYKPEELNLSICAMLPDGSPVVFPDILFFEADKGMFFYKVWQGAGFEELLSHQESYKEALVAMDQEQTRAA